MSDYSNRSTDRGGPTKYGVTHRTPAAHRGLKSVTADQVKGISRKKAVDIYQRSFWLQCGGDLLPPGLDYATSP
jgi:lysozyme family protein